MFLQCCCRGCNCEETKWKPLLAENCRFPPIFFALSRQIRQFWIIWDKLFFNIISQGNIFTWHVPNIRVILEREKICPSWELRFERRFFNTTLYLFLDLVLFSKSVTSATFLNTLATYWRCQPCFLMNIVNFLNFWFKMMI